jgi:hypothetical protein
MTLELNHLSAYLPFNVLVCETDDIENSIQKLTLSNFQEIVELPLTTTALILRPLSDLTKEIEHNGEKFVPRDMISIGFGNFIEEGVFYYCAEKSDIKRLSYDTIVKLLEWHFDVFGLIEKGLAIDINSIKSTEPIA